MKVNFKLSFYCLDLPVNGWLLMGPGPPFFFCGGRGKVKKKLGREREKILCNMKNDCPLFA
jgi:hypothetical protein